jgi:DNA-binding response OmpR family regulator
MSDQPRTALGSAHERFLRTLPDRGHELRELAGKLQSAPGDERMVEQIGRRLHALYASAQVFQEEPLLRAIKVSLGGMETARLERRPPTPGELDSTLSLCDWLEGEVSGDADDLQHDSYLPRASASNRSGHDGLRTDGRVSGGAGNARARHDIDRPGERAEQAVSVAQTVTGTVPAPEVIAVLVVARVEVEQEVRAALPEEQCELTSSADAETALAVIDDVAPDLVLIETALFGSDASEVVRRLRGARAGGVRAVIAIVPEHATDVEALLSRTHVDAVLRLPLAPSGLLEQLLRWSGRGARLAGGIETLQAGTVEEIARGVAEEIRRGIAGSLRLGRAERIELGDKSELLAATWSAVSRVRAHLTKRGDGRVRFDEAPYPGSPAALALTEREAAERYLGLTDAMRGKRMLIADDDPAVLWFFAGLLREAGAVAIEARNGRAALESARRTPPDLVISDILMPEIDGFTLCRELRRDLTLAHVPVILLSWKEDFLQRMRELDAGAAGYLRKEAGSHQILATVAEALRPRTELASLLVAGSEVHGRIEPLGIPVLLRTVANLRPDARVTVHDAWNLFDADVRGGSSLAVTRTASDGSFARGAVALRQLLGVDSGRFSVASASGPARGALPEPLDRLLADGLRQLGAVLDAVSDNRLMRVSRVALDDEILSSLLTATPTGLADVAARLRAGEPARDLVLTGAVTARDLEQHLRELARRGAVLGVFGVDGEDLVEAARLAREQEPGALLHAGERPRPSPLPTELVDSDVEWMDPPAVHADASAIARLARAAAATPEAAADARVTRASVADTAPSSTADAPDDGASVRAADTLPEPPRTRRNTPPYPMPEVLVNAQASAEGDASAAVEDGAPSEPRQRRRVVALGPALAAEQSKGEPFVVRSSLLHGAAQPQEPLHAPTQSPAHAADAPPAAESTADGEWLKLAFVLAALMFLGFVGWRVLQSRAPAQRAHMTAVASGGPGDVGTAEPATALPPNAGAGAETAQAGAAATSDTVLGFGRVLPFIDRSRGVAVAAEEGLLVVEFEAAGPPPRVRVGGRDLGTAPIAAALSAGRHEIVLKRGQQTSFRYVVIRSGETRIVQIRD